jgi:hypothetical protein
MIVVLPQASAGAAFQAKKCKDAFHAVIPTQTPNGSGRTILMKPSSPPYESPLSLSAHPA